MQTQSLPITLFAALTIALAPAIAGPTATPANADSCGPSFREIYDFQVGDVFQVSHMTGTYGNGASGSQIEEKYKIVSREIVVGGYRYGIEGQTRGVFSSFSPYGGPSMIDTGYGNINGIWEITDSTSRKALNACKDRVVKFPTAGSQFAGTDGQNSGLPPASCFTRVRIAVGDLASFPLADSTTRLKILGSPRGSPAGNLYTDSALKAASPDEAWAVYAPGLGLVRMTAMVFESQVEYQLQGYSRGGVTVGTVYPDAAFISPNAVRLAHSTESRYSPILRYAERGLILVRPGTSDFRDFTGRRSIALPVAESARLNP